MGLKLVHSEENTDKKPRVFVVGEEQVFDVLNKDLALDVHPVCFDYSTFVQAYLSKSITTNNSIIIVSDSLSEKIAPLEALVALVRDNIILIPWQASHETINKLNIKCTSRRPTLNTLRRSIFNHVGLEEPPPRYDGDVNIEVPQSGAIVDFNLISNEGGIAKDVVNKKIVHDRMSMLQNKLKRSKPIGAISNKEAQSLNHEFGSMRQDIGSISPTGPQADISQASLVDFLPMHTTSNDFEMTFDSRPNVDEIETTKPSTFSKKFFEESNELADEKPEYLQSEFSLPKEPTFTLENETIGNSHIQSSQFNSVNDLSSKSEVPLFAFGEHDSNGNQSMWPMYESKDDLSDAKGSLNMNDFPTITDGKKQISIKEPMVICVYSPKGGVGKTSISVNLAARLSYTTRAQVCIVDLDIGFGNVGTRLGLYSPTVRELLDEKILDSEALSRNLVFDRRSGLFALLAPLRPESGTNRRKFAPTQYDKILALLKLRFDIVILDCPVELRDPLVSGFALTCADKVVMVVNNEQATLLDARRALEAICRSKESQRLPGLGIDPKKIGLIVNQKVDNVGREVDDVMQIISGSDENHPSKKVELLAVIDDDRELWVGNANMARTIATSGENIVDIELDKIWEKLIPENIKNNFESTQSQSSQYTSKLDEIFSNKAISKEKRKIRRMFHIGRKKEKNNGQ